MSKNLPPILIATLRDAGGMSGNGHTNPPAYTAPSQRWSRCKATIKSIRRRVLHSRLLIQRCPKPRRLSSAAFEQRSEHVDREELVFVLEGKVRVHPRCTNLEFQLRTGVFNNKKQTDHLR